MKFLILTTLIFFNSTFAYAYIDPGFIAGFFNLIVASLASLAVIFIFRPYYYFKNLFNRIFKKDRENLDNVESKDENKKESE